MVSFEFKRSYGSIEELRADLSGDNIAIWPYACEVAVSYIDDDHIVIFEIEDDGSLKFLKYEELSFI